MQSSDTMARNKGKSKVMDWLHEHANYQGDDCLTTWPFYRNPNGYGQIGLNGRTAYAHRVMCELVHGPSPDGMEAAHSCGNGHLCCVNPMHLAWKTKKENRQESTMHGKGGRHGYGNKGKLRPNDIAEILSLKGKMRMVDIGERFGVNWTTISSVYCGKTHVKTVKAILDEQS